MARPRWTRRAGAGCGKGGSLTEPWNEPWSGSRSGPLGGSWFGRRRIRRDGCRVRRGRRQRCGRRGGSDRIAPGGEGGGAVGEPAAGGDAAASSNSGEAPCGHGRLEAHGSLHAGFDASCDENPFEAAVAERAASASSVYSPASREAKRKAPFFAVVVRSSAPVAWLRRTMETPASGAECRSVRRPAREPD